MKAFLITGTKSDIAVHRYVNVAAARIASADGGVVIKNLEDLEAFSKGDLIEVFNQVSADPVKRFDNKPTAMAKVYAALKSATTLIEETADKIKKVSYQAKLRELFKDGGSFDIDVIAEKLGTDRRNASVAISILRNEVRTKNTLNVVFDRNTKTYHVAPPAAVEPAASETSGNDAGLAGAC